MSNYPYPSTKKYDYKAQDTLPLKEIATLILYKWYYFAIAGVLSLLIGTLFIKSQPREYAVRASLMFKGQNNRTQGSDEFMKEMGLFMGTNEIEDKIGLMTSSSVMEKAIKQLPVGVSFSQKGFFSMPVSKRHLPFVLYVDTSHFQLTNLTYNLSMMPGNQVHISAEGKDIPLYDIQKDEILELVPEYSIDQVLMLGDTLESPYHRFSLSANPAFSMLEIDQTYQFQLHSLYNLVNWFQQKISINPIGVESNVVELSTEGPLIPQEKEFLEELILAYQETIADQHENQGKTTLNFIDSQIKNVADSLRQAENLLESYRSASEVIDVSTTSSTLTTQLVKLEDEKADMELKSRYYNYLKQQLEKGADETQVVAPFPADVQNPILNNLLIELAQLNLKMSELEYSSSQINPIRESLEFQIKNTKKSLNQNINNLIQSSRLTLEGLEEKIADVQTKIRRLPRNEKEINKLDRQFRSIDNLYNYLVEKRAEASIALGNSADDILIIDKPRLVSTKPVSPNKILIYLMCLVIAMALPAAYIVGSFLINEKITNVSDIKMLTDVPYLGAVVRNDTNTHLLLPDETSFSRLADSFRAIRVHLSYLTTEVPKQLIAVTSTKPGEGKSFFSANMSSILAQANKKTILVDMDLRLPSQMEYFVAKENAGLSNYLADQVSLSEIIHSTPITGLDYIPAGTPNHNPVDLFDSDRINALLAELRETYTHVILDLPPLGVTSDYFMLKSVVDYTVYIVRQGITNMNDVNFIDHNYLEKKIENVGIVVNDVTERGGTSYGGYGYGYGDYGRRYEKMNKSRRKARKISLRRWAKKVFQKS